MAGERMTSKPKSYWSDAPWEAWPPMRKTREEALRDGEDIRQRQIESLLRQIEQVRSRVIGVEEYDPDVEGYEDA